MILMLIKTRLKLLQQTTLTRHNKLTLLIRVCKDKQAIFITPNYFRCLLKKQPYS